ncbi:MAG TPA: transglutaminase-like cysteine peptidase, partial [Alphaproteobacteria bacterium]
EKQYSADLTPLYKWTDVLERMDTEESAAAVFSSEQSMRALPAVAAVEKVNETVNSFPFIDDHDLTRKSDYWQTPAEFVSHGGGDCEDFAIAKYSWLQVLGIPEQSMRIAIVSDAVRGKPHALLLVDLKDRKLALDNRTKETESHIVMAQYTPIFSFNREGWWRY